MGGEPRVPVPDYPKPAITKALIAYPATGEYPGKRVFVLVSGATRCGTLVFTLSEKKLLPV